MRETFNLSDIFSESIVDRYFELEESINIDEFQVESLQDVSYEDQVSEEVKEYFQLQNLITLSLLQEAVNRVDLDPKVDVTLEVKSEPIYLPFRLVVQGFGSTCMKGMPDGKFYPADQEEEYIEKQVDAIEKLAGHVN